jgi:hypothetical protein
MLIKLNICIVAIYLPYTAGNIAAILVAGYPCTAQPSYRLYSPTRKKPHLESTNSLMNTTPALHKHARVIPDRIYFALRISFEQIAYKFTRMMNNINNRPARMCQKPFASSAPVDLWVIGNK